MNKICNECGRNVKFSAKKGGYVNRIIDLNDYKCRKNEMGKPFPKGDFICRECDEKIRNSPK